MEAPIPSKLLVATTYSCVIRKILSYVTQFPTLDDKNPLAPHVGEYGIISAREKRNFPASFGDGAAARKTIYWNIV